MQFSLLVPAFLAGLAAIGIPIVLHLRHRDKDKPTQFPSLMFLEQLPIRTADRRRITDWPLLLLRAIALALLVLAFARPLFSRSVVSELAKRQRAVVIMLDRSMSMSRDGVWQPAMDSARAVLASMQQGDRVAVVLFDDEAEVAQPLTLDRALAGAVLAKAKPTHRGTRYAAALRAARQITARAGDAKPEVITITDVQRSGVSGVVGLDLPEGLSVRTIAVGPKEHANVTVASVDIHRNIEATRTSLAVQARVLSRDGKLPRAAHVVLTLNGRESGAKNVNVPANGDVVVPFDAVLLPAGHVRGMITLDRDALVADDTFHFAFAADDAIRVALVVPDDADTDETLYFERALGVGRAPSVIINRMRLSQLSARAIQNAAIVVLWDVRTASNQAISEFVERGGGLVEVTGRRAPVKAVATALFPAAITGSAERISDRGGSFGDVRLDHPLFAPFRDAPTALAAARFLRYPVLRADAGSDVIARFDDGAPAVIDKRAGLGRILIVAAPLEARSGTFPLQPAFLPFLQRLALYASARDATVLARATGQSWLLPGSLKEPAVLTPSGAIVRPTRDSVGSTVALREAGVYALYEGRVQGEPIDLLAVNAPASESDLATVDPRELLLGVRQTSVSESAPDATPTRAEIEGRQRLWRILLAVAALLLLCETFLGNRGWRGTASRLTASPSSGEPS